MFKLNGVLGFIYEMLESLVISLVIFLLVYFFLAFPEEVSGASMEPTLYTGDRLIVERLTAKLNKIQRGDIVILNPPGRDVDFVKRVIGMPGESLLIADCKVNLVKDNFEKIPLDEPYLSPDICTKGVEPIIIKIPADSYYVLGDNREHSADSRFFGTLKKDRIDGKVFTRFWPLNKFTKF